MTNDSPSTRRPSHVFLNDYNASAINNLAPAGNEEEEEDIMRLEQSSKVVDMSSLSSKIRSRFLRGRKSSLSPPRSRSEGLDKHLQEEEKRSANNRLPVVGSQQQSSAGNRANHVMELTSMTSQTKPSFSHSLRRDELQVDFPTSRSCSHKKKSDEMPGKERRKVFQRLADEKVADEFKFKNRKLKSSYIKDKFGPIGSVGSIPSSSSEYSSSGTLGGSFSDHRSSLSEFPQLQNDDIDDNFVDGLIFLAPSSESTIRELVQKQPSQLSTSEHHS